MNFGFWFLDFGLKEFWVHAHLLLEDLKSSIQNLRSPNPVLVLAGSIQNPCIG